MKESLYNANAFHHQRVVPEEYSEEELHLPIELVNYFINNIRNVLLYFHDNCRKRSTVEPFFSWITHRQMPEVSILNSLRLLERGKLIDKVNEVLSELIYFFMPAHTDEVYVETNVEHCDIVQLNHRVSWEIEGIGRLLGSIKNRMTKLAFEKTMALQEKIDDKDRFFFNNNQSTSEDMEMESIYPSTSFGDDSMKSCQGSEFDSFHTPPTSFISDQEPVKQTSSHPVPRNSLNQVAFSGPSPKFNHPPTVTKSRERGPHVQAPSLPNSTKLVAASFRPQNGNRELQKTSEYRGKIQFSPEQELKIEQLSFLMKLQSSRKQPSVNKPRSSHIQVVSPFPRFDRRVPEPSDQIPPFSTDVAKKNKNHDDVVGICSICLYKRYRNHEWIICKRCCEVYHMKCYAERAIHSPYCPKCSSYIYTDRNPFV